MQKSVRIIATVLIILLVFVSCENSSGNHQYMEKEILQHAVDFGIKQGMMELASESGGLRTYCTDGFTASDGTYIKGTAMLESDGSFRAISLSEVCISGHFGKYELKLDGKENLAWLEEYEIICDNPALDGFPYMDAPDSDFSLVLHFSDGSTTEHDFRLERDDNGHLTANAYFYFAGMDHNVQFPVGEFSLDTKIQTVKIRQLEQIENMEAFTPEIFEVWIRYDNGYEHILKGEGLVFLMGDDDIINYGDNVYADVEGIRYFANIEVGPTPHILVDAYIEQNRDFLEGDEFDVSAFDIYGVYKDGSTEPISTKVSIINSLDSLVHHGSKVQAVVYLNEEITPTVIEKEIQCYEIARIYPTNIPLYLAYKDGDKPEYFSVGAVAVYEKEGKELTRTLRGDEVWYDIQVDTSAINTTSGVPAILAIYAGPKSKPVSTCISTEAIRLGDYYGSLPKKMLNMELLQDRVARAGEYLDDNDFSVLARYDDLSTVIMLVEDISTIVDIQISGTDSVHVGDTATVTTTFSSSNSMMAGMFTTTFPIAVLNS